MVSAACGPRRSYVGAGAGDREDRRSGIAARDREGAGDGEGCGMDPRRARTAQEQGRPQGPEGSLGKLASSIIARVAARVHTSLLGPDALLTGDDSPMNGLLAEILVSVPASSIAGGTDEIQRNIISGAEDAARADRRHGEALQGCSAKYCRLGWDAALGRKRAGLSSKGTSPLIVLGAGERLLTARRACSREREGSPLAQADPICVASPK
jgi:Acyl-CoA dehydrogenase, C-terminal domain